MKETANLTTGEVRSERSPGDNYENILARDHVASPDYYREGPTPAVGTEPVAASRYFDPAFLQKENDYVFPRVWQWACREEDIPNVGDHVVFDLGAHSWIVVRSGPNEFKALSNVCPHRGRQILETDGNRPWFRCAYHGLQWHHDGTVKHNPFGWDMPQWDDCGANLPQAQVAVWGGFVFINMDHTAPPLEEMLAPIPEHFERYDLAGKYKAAHVVKKIRANWKATCEAFMESHHVVGTHPQVLNSTGDLNSQYDNWSDYVGRQFTASGVQSPNVEATLTEQEIHSYFSGADTTLPSNTTARAFSAERMRESMKAQLGHDYSASGDAEMLDSLLYNVFPNLSFWAGVPQNIVYRFRPNGMDPESAIMDIVILRPFPKDGPRPEPVPVRYLDFDEPVMSAADEVGGMLAEIFDQDVVNLPWVQKGLHALPSGKVAFTSYMEQRLRRHHQMLDKLIAEGEARS